MSVALLPRGSASRRRRRRRRRRVALPTTVVISTTCIAAIQGFQHGPVPSRWHRRLWTRQTSDCIPNYPLNVPFRTVRSLRFSSSCGATPSLYGQKIDDSNGAEEMELAEEISWEAGNVEEDFRNLEQAIALSMADQHLQQQERLDMLDYFAQQRKPLFNTVRSDFFKPLLVSLLLTSLARGFPVPSESLLRLMVVGFDVHFALAYVATPAAFLAMLSFRNRVKSLQDANSHSSALSYLPRQLTAHKTRLSVFGEDRSVDPALDDPVVCLLEQWLSASLGVVVALPYFLGYWQNPRIVSAISMMTKVAVFASLHQFPLLYYRVFRPNQPKPVAWDAWFFSCMVKTLLLPWCIVPDLVRLGLSWSWPQVALAHGALCAAVAGITYGTLPRPSGNDLRPMIPRRGLLLATLVMAGAAQHSQTLRAAFSYLVRAAATKISTVAVSPADLWDAAQLLARPIVVLLATIGPCIHLGAYWRLLRVSHCDGLSLADLQDNGIRLQVSNPVRDQRKMWRWRLQWREPRRVPDIVNQWRRNFVYWLFLQGSVQEKVRRERYSKRRDAKQDIAHQRGEAVLQKVALDRARDRDEGLPPPDRTQWKPAAMDRLARVHARNYDRNDLQDVLGIAVYKSIGIGLGFNFDYMSSLPVGVKPSTRRLQARAAKSAIRRVQEIYDADRVRRELDEISDPIERDRRARELRDFDQREIEAMATKLSNMIPLDMKLDIPSSNYVRDYTLGGGSESSSSLFLRLLHRDSSQAIERLLERYADLQDRRASSATGEDSEFIEAWERQRYGRYSDGDGNSTTVTALA